MYERNGRKGKMKISSLNACEKRLYRKFQKLRSFLLFEVAIKKVILKGVCIQTCLAMK